MKTNWPAYRLACLLLVSLALMASPMTARPGSPAPVVRVDAKVSGQTVRIETKASGPFEYTSYRPSQNLLIVDFTGVASAEPSGAQVLKSNVVGSYRVLQHRAGENVGVRLEILLRTAVEPRFERRSPDELTLIFDAKSTPVSARLDERPSPAVSPSSPASLIARVEVGRTGKQATVRVEGNGRLSYHASRLSSPDRLVLDFSGVHLAQTQTSIPSDVDPVRSVRLGQFKLGVARVVIDLERTVPYSVKAEGKTVTVAFAAATPAPSSAAVATKAVTPHEKDAATPHPTEIQQSSTQLAAIEISGMPLPESLTQRTAVFASPAPKNEPSARLAADPAPVQAPAAQAPAAAPAPQAAAKYAGEPISVNLKDVDLKDFFRLIHEISGLNVVLDPNVRGTLTIVLDDVPWDQALDIVLRNNSLDKQLEGNVLRLATRDTLKKEAETRRDLAKAEAEAVDQVTTTRVLSYAKATALRDTLKRFLSSRGEILADERSNTLIIRDIPSVLPALDNLIRQLDRKSQQVEIEARIVAASRAFAEDIGTQFAFATATAPNGQTIFGGASAVGTSPVAVTGGAPPPLVVSGGSSLPLISNFPATVSPTGSGVTIARRSPNFALDFILTAAETKGVGKLLSKPKVITQNNEKATVKQGTKIPIQTTINNTVSVQFIDAVLKLEVTPQVTAEGTVFMDVVVENTSIDTGIPRVQGIPALDTQSVEAKVLINDGGTVVIGGVIISSQRTDISQVPLFGSMPLIGHLFKRTTVSTQSQELLFFLTPRIVPS